MAGSGFIDLTGKVFSAWTVLKLTDKRQGKYLLYTCKCRCGHIRDITANNLKAKKTLGCAQCFYKRRIKDLTEKQYGDWTVTGVIEERRKGVFYYLCICKCGNRGYLRKTQLMNTKTDNYCKDCSTINQRQNLVGKRSGKLTVVRFTGEKQGQTEHLLWECLCDCGNTKLVTTSHINQKMVSSCGCLSNDSKFIDLTGKRVNKLHIISMLPYKNSKNKVLWFCLCDCGNTTKLTSGVLNSGRQKSCGCRARGSRKLGTIYGIYSNDDKLVYIGQTINYKLERRLDLHINYPSGDMKNWFSSIDYRPTIKSLIRNVKTENLDSMEKFLIKTIVNEYHPLLNITHNPKPNTFTYQVS